MNKSRLRFSLRTLLVATSLTAVVLAVVVYWRTPRLKRDIKARIRADFPAEQREEVQRLLLAYSPKFTRMHRCILHVADGDLDELKRCADDAQMDYRDVILLAEYEMTPDGMEKMRDYSRTFDAATKRPFDIGP